MRRQWFAIDWSCCLGAGGEGEVYLGRSLHTGELCAVKVSVCLDPQVARQQLAEELQRYLQAAGDGVVGLVAWNLEADPPFLAFELAHMGTLADEIRELRQQGRVFHPVRALRRIREILVALANVHARGLIHRDVKPANLLRFGEAIKLTDLGTACLTEARTDGGRSQPPGSDDCVGTPMYGAPEQHQGLPADERADLYSVGRILQEMLTGHAPDVNRPSDLAAASQSVLFLPELEELAFSLSNVHKARRPTTAKEAIERVDLLIQSYDRVRSTWQQLGLGRSPY